MAAGSMTPASHREGAGSRSLAAHPFPKAQGNTFLRARHGHFVVRFSIRKNHGKTRVKSGKFTKSLVFEIVASGGLLRTICKKCARPVGPNFPFSENAKFSGRSLFEINEYSRANTDDELLNYYISQLFQFSGQVSVCYPYFNHFCADGQMRVFEPYLL